MSAGRTAVEELYREVVLDHYRQPRNREPLQAPDGAALVHNPVCGDQVRVEVGLGEGGRVERISARGRGCSIAVAAGSVMSELVGGLDAQAVAALARRLEALVGGGAPDPDLDPRLRAFERVADLPSRRRCALLAWEALEQALGDAGAPRGAG